MGSSVKTIKGKNILMEDLKQICIHKQNYDTAKGRSRWWEYMVTFHEYCYGNVNRDCSELSHSFNFLTYEDTMACVNNAFQKDGKIINVEYEKDPQNEIFNSPDLVIDLLDKESEYYKEYGPNVYPGIVVNNQTIRGQIEVEAVFNDICAGFLDRPYYCMKYI